MGNLPLGLIETVDMDLSVLEKIEELVDNQRTWTECLPW